MVEISENTIELRGQNYYSGNASAVKGKIASEEDIVAMFINSDDGAFEKAYITEARSPVRFLNV